jgi:hypothetical protein
MGAQAPADAVEQRIVAGLLAAPDPGQQAWGAYLAGNYGQTKFVPELRRLLTATHPDVQLQALDSLIRLGAKVPAEELLLLWPTHRAPVLILLAMAPQDNEPPLRSLTRDDLNPKEWTAVYNLRVANKAPGIAAELLSELTVHVSVRVRDSETLGPGYGGTGGGGVVCGGSGFRPGFPPLYSYKLVDLPAQGDVLLAPGRHPIYYRRDLSTSTSFNAIDKNIFRFEYLADLLATQPDQLPLQPAILREVVWKGAEAYLAELRDAREQVNRGFQGLMRQLQERELLTGREADGLRPQVEFTVIDGRAERQPPLPEVPGATIPVERSTPES